MLKKPHIKPQPALSRRERQILDILYAAGEGSARDVLDRLPDPPSYSTVRALLARMLEKKLVSHRRDGKQYLYRPVENRDGAQKSAVRHLVETFFDSSPAAAANALLGMDADQLTREELAELRQLIDRLESHRDD